MKVPENVIKQWERELENINENNLNQEGRATVLKNNIKEFYDKKSEAARIRSSVNWYEKGEKSSKYFFNLEKKSGCEKIMDEG